jgi:hypothetical protein
MSGPPRFRYAFIAGAVAAFIAGGAAGASEPLISINPLTAPAASGGFAPVAAALVAGLGFLLLQGLWRRGR